MSGDFFEQLEIPEPDTNLKAGGGSQAKQTANIMVRFEKELLAHPTNLVLVVGDVTSTMACAIVVQKLHTKVAHVEGGIRSNDWTMPEETTVMGVPCMTLRDNTERLETITQGTNELIGRKPKAIQPAMKKLFSGNWKTGYATPLLWDGKTAERIVDILLNIDWILGSKTSQVRILKTIFLRGLLIVVTIKILNLHLLFKSYI